MAGRACWPTHLAIPRSWLQVNPDGSVDLDCMFKGPELTQVYSTFGYRDREPRPTKNPFTQFHNPGQGEWFPNIVTT
jgi:hypothetical protein